MMFAYPLRTVVLTAVAVVGLSACATPYGYGPYGYGGASVGAGNGYYDPYYGGYGYGAGYPGYGYGAGYPGYGYGAGYPGYGYAYAPYWGWYDNFYYPGTGFYVYDSYRRPHRWTDAHRRYWTVRRERAVSTSTTRQPVVIRENWRDFDRSRVRARPNRVEQRIERPVRVERSRTEPIERSRPVRVDRTPTRIESTRSVLRAERSARPTRVERSSARAEAKERAATQAERGSKARSSVEQSDRPRRGRGRNSEQ
jgi:hypothetical protein